MLFVQLSEIALPSIVAILTVSRIKDTVTGPVRPPESTRVNTAMVGTTLPVWPPRTSYPSLISEYDRVNVLLHVSTILLGV